MGDMNALTELRKASRMEGDYMSQRVTAIKAARVVGMSFGEIAAHLGITRQRVHQIAAALDSTAGKT